MIKEKFDYGQRVTAYIEGDRMTEEHDFEDFENEDDNPTLPPPDDDLPF